MVHRFELAYYGEPRLSAFFVGDPDVVAIAKHSPAACNANEVFPRHRVRLNPSRRPIRRNNSDAIAFERIINPFPNLVRAYVVGSFGLEREMRMKPKPKPIDVSPEAIAKRERKRWLAGPMDFDPSGQIGRPPDRSVNPSNRCQIEPPIEIPP